MVRHSSLMLFIYLLYNDTVQSHSRGCPDLNFYHRDSNVMKEQFCYTAVPQKRLSLVSPSPVPHCLLYLFQLCVFMTFQLYVAKSGVFMSKGSTIAITSYQCSSSKHPVRLWNCSRILFPLCPHTYPYWNMDTATPAALSINYAFSHASRLSGI